MIEPSWWVGGVVLPAAVGALLGWATRLAGLWGASAGTGPGFALNVGLAVGYMTGYIATMGHPPIPPAESQQWLVVVLMPIALAIAAVGAGRRVPRWIGYGLWLLFALAVPPVLLQSYLKYNWSGQAAAGWLASLGGAGAVQYVLWRYHAGRVPSWAGVLLLMIAAGGTGVVLMVSGSVVLGKLGLMLGSVLLGLAAACLLPWGSGGVAGGAGSGVGVAVVILIGLWINGYFYASVDAINAVLLACAPVAGLVGDVPPLRRRGGIARVIVRVLAVSAPIAVAVARAGVAFSRAAGEPNYY